MTTPNDVYLVVILRSYGFFAAFFWACSLRRACRLKGRRAPIWLLGLLLIPPCLFWGPLMLIAAFMPGPKPNNDSSPEQRRKGENDAS